MRRFVGVAVACLLLLAFAAPVSARSLAVNDFQDTYFDNYGSFTVTFR